MLLLSCEETFMVNLNFSHKKNFYNKQRKFSTILNLSHFFYA